MEIPLLTEAAILGTGLAGLSMVAIGYYVGFKDILKQKNIPQRKRLAVDKQLIPNRWSDLGYYSDYQTGKKDIFPMRITPIEATPEDVDQMAKEVDSSALSPTTSTFINYEVDRYLRIATELEKPVPDLDFLAIENITPQIELLSPYQRLKACEKSLKLDNIRSTTTLPRGALYNIDLSAPQVTQPAGLQNRVLSNSL